MVPAKLRLAVTRRPGVSIRRDEGHAPRQQRSELPDGATGADLARAIGPGLAKAALAVRVDGQVADLAAPLPDGEQVEIVTDRSPDALDLIRHDAAHVMATAVMELYPGTKVSIGPPIENGFYYDFEFPEGVKVSDEDLERDRGADARARRGRRAVRAHRRAGRRGRAALRASEGQDYKVELIRDLVATRASRPSRSTATARSPTSAAARTRPRPGASRRSSCCRSPAPTGAATSATRC